MLNGIELSKKYVGKEVVYRDGEKARISEITSYQIEVKDDNGHYLAYRTGTGDYDNVIANGGLKFVDETLQSEFIEDYEQYVNSGEGRFESFEYYAQVYD